MLPLNSIIMMDLADDEESEQSDLVQRQLSLLRQRLHQKDVLSG